MIDFEDIRQKVVAQHNVLLGRDDAILVTVTLNEMVLSRYFEMAARHAETTSRELSVAIQRQTEQSKEVAGKIITAAADYVRKEVHEAVKSAAAEAASEFSIEITGKIGDATATSRAAELRSRRSNGRGRLPWPQRSWPA